MPRHKQSDPTSIKTQVIRLRVTEAEAEKFRSKAAESGCKTVSEYMRQSTVSLYHRLLLIRIGILLVFNTI